MGMFNPSWFRQLADSARELLLDDDFIERPQKVFKPRLPDSCFSVDDPVWVIWASQTGAAEAFARDTIEFLQASGLTVRDVPFDTLELSSLQSAVQALLLVSTSYDGDPPDMAEEFSLDAMKRPAPLAQLRYGLLALGDRCYEDFCGFGHQLQTWFTTSQAQAFFDMIEVDDENEDALKLWRTRITAMLPSVSDKRVLAER